MHERSRLVQVTAMPDASAPKTTPPTHDCCGPTYHEAQPLLHIRLLGVPEQEQLVALLQGGQRGRRKAGTLAGGVGYSGGSGSLLAKRHTSCPPHLWGRLWGLPMACGEVQTCLQAAAGRVLRAEAPAPRLASALARPPSPANWRPYLAGELGILYHGCHRRGGGLSRGPGQHRLPARPLPAQAAHTGAGGKWQARGVELARANDGRSAPPCDGHTCRRHSMPPACRPHVSFLESRCLQTSSGSQRGQSGQKSG